MVEEKIEEGIEEIERLSKLISDLTIAGEVKTIKAIEIYKELGRIWSYIVRWS